MSFVSIGYTVEFSVSICVANVDFILPLEQITVWDNENNKMKVNWEFEVLALHAAVSVSQGLIDCTTSR